MALSLVTDKRVSHALVVEATDTAVAGAYPPYFLLLLDVCFRRPDFKGR